MLARALIVIGECLLLFVRVICVVLSSPKRLLSTRTITPTPEEVLRIGSPTCYIGDAGLNDYASLNENVAAIIKRQILSGR